MTSPPRFSPRKVPLTGRRAIERQRGAGNGRHAGLVGNAPFLLLAFAVVSLLVSVAFVFSSGSASPVASAGNQAATSATAAGISGDEWIPLRSRAPADIIAAARQSALFHESRADNGDHVRDLSRLGRPILVQALRPTGMSANEMPDFYIVPILNAAGAATDAAELALNPAHTAVQVIAIVTYTEPRVDGSIAWQRADQAIHAVTSQRHASAQAIGQPYLVYFPLDPQSQTGQNGQPIWTAGGALPADPIWLMPLKDGTQYLAGNDGRVYTVSQLPFWHG